MSFFAYALQLLPLFFWFLQVCRHICGACHTSSQRFLEPLCVISDDSASPQVSPGSVLKSLYKRTSTIHCVHQKRLMSCVLFLLLFPQLELSSYYSLPLYSIRFEMLSITIIKCLNSHIWCNSRKFFYCAIANWNCDLRAVLS